MKFNYAKEREKAFRNLADHCHDKAIEQVSPHLAARWISLMETMLWCASGDGTMDDNHCAEPSTPAEKSNDRS